MKDIEPELSPAEPESNKETPAVEPDTVESPSGEATEAKDDVAEEGTAEEKAGDSDEAQKPIVEDTSAAIEEETTPISEVVCGFPFRR